MFRRRSSSEQRHNAREVCLPLATALLRDAEPGRGVVAVLTSTYHGEGVTFIAGGLAAALSGQCSVLLVPADGSAHDSPLPSGVTLQTVAELREEGIRLRGTDLGPAVAALRHRHHVTIIEAPPAGQDPLAAALAHQVDYLYVIARSGVTRTAALQRTVGLLGAGRVTGVILNDVRGLAPAWLRRMTA